MQEQLSAINLALCVQFKSSFEISKPHQLSLISKQQLQLGKQPAGYRTAHTAYMINTLKPFATNNMRTAVTYVYQQFPKLPDANKQALAGMIKHGADVQSMAEILQ